LGLTFSKSVRFGAVRFNFTGSGIGISTGIPGLRIGTGPRGAYISAGKWGFRYRASLSSHRRFTSSGRSSATSAQSPGSAQPLKVDQIADREILETQSVMQLEDTNADQLLEQIRAQNRKFPWWKLAAVATLLLGAAAVDQSDEVLEWSLRISLIAAVGLTIWLRWRSRLGRLTVLFYDLAEPIASAYESLSTAATSANRMSSIWSLQEQVKLADKKYNAGANFGVRRTRTTFPVDPIETIKANFEVPSLKTKETTYLLLPDTIIVVRGAEIGAVPWGDIQISHSNTNFAEDESVPRDAVVTGHTWRYVNKKGGPDRRFKDNREIPWCNYDRLTLRSSGGMTAAFMCSAPGGFGNLARAIEALSTAAREGEHLSKSVATGLG